jgi:hypothetical protein
MLESLCDRVVPSVTSVVSGGGTILTISGDATANVVDIVDDGNTLTITGDGQNLNVPATITKVVISLGSGGDTVNYTLTGNLAASSTRSIDVSLGNGNDTFTGTLQAGIAAGASLNVVVRGMNGDDDLSFTGSASDVATGGALSVVLGGGNGKDNLNDLLAGVFLGDVTLSASGGNGKDNVSSNVTADATSTGNVDTQVLGGNAPDRLTLMMMDNSGVTTSTLASLSAIADGGQGPDFATVSDYVDVISATK